MSAYAKPLPKLDTLNRPFWELARDHKLAVQACADCGDRHFPPTPVCPGCLSKNQGWEVVSGRGTLLSWVTFHRAYWGGFAGDLPYDVCLVELDEGPVLVSNLVGAAEGGFQVGDRVEVIFERATDEITLPKFVLAR
ncbi:MAG: OB-fold domain-containing protein [Alphaproteobacteria bacterium]|nr:OB-fold domain-containing protein [Alphaproteobacteria bacterium]